MRYGYVDDDAREYVIERPDTPTPWINYLGENDYGAIVSNNAGGYAFYKSPGLGRVLRYRFNAVPADRPGRYLYLRDTDGDFWSASWNPVRKPLDRQKVVCRHGLGYTRIHSRYRDIESNLLYLVPANEPFEIWKADITNSGTRARELDVFTYAEFAVPVFAREFDLQYYLFTIIHTFNDHVIGRYIGNTTDYMHHTFFSSHAPVTSFDTERDAFIGPWRDEANPLAVERGRCSGQLEQAGNSCAALQHRITLQPGETWSNVYALGVGDAAETGRRARETFGPERVAEEYDRLRERWDERLRALQCRVPDPLMASSVNIWNACQSQVTFKWSRSASLVEAGGRDGVGYRDTLQDTFGVTHTEPTGVRKTLTGLLKGQVSSGGTLHGFQPLTLQTGRGEVPDKFWSDDHLWILLAAERYLCETGDLAFLDHVVPWLDHGEASVYEHGRMALEFAGGQTGSNGLLLGLAADWNDSLNMRRNKGESVFTSMLYCAALDAFARMADAVNRDDDAARARQRSRDMAALINARAWDGAWYLRAVLGTGRPVGSAANAEGSIFIESNTWAVLSGVAPRERALAAMDALHERLATPYGVRTCAPSYTAPDGLIGGMTLFPPSYKENGSVFCHAGTWPIVAEAMLGRAERAFEYYRALLPGAWNDRIETRRVEPYVYCQFIKGPDDLHAGQGCNPWLTGTAPWAYVAATQHLLGIRPALNGLLVDPCVPADWDAYEVTRRFRGARYRIAVRNPDGCTGGVAELTVDGRTVEGNTIPVAKAGSEVQVEAVLCGRRDQA